MRRNEQNRVAGIEYSGLPGTSKECQDAVMRLLQYGDRISRARILTNSNTHCLLLTVNVGDLIAIKTGFASGYGGEGPSTFSYVLQLLNAHGAEIEEYDVSEDLIERLDASSLLQSDIDKLDTAKPVRPSRWYDYVREDDWNHQRSGEIWREFDPVVPFAIIDNRIADLALSFWDGPSDRLLTGYRRLEDLIRKRTGLSEHGARLFSQAFQGSSAQLVWKGLDEGEQEGRALLFIAAYKAHRNPRAHRELKEYAGEQLTEFLVLNHLFLLEKGASELDEAQTARVKRKPK
jgi:hypothetical protein